MSSPDNERLRAGAVDALAYLNAFLDGQAALGTPAEHGNWATMQKILLKSDETYGVGPNLAYLFLKFAESTGTSRDQFREWPREAGRWASTNNPEEVDDA